MITYRVVIIFLLFLCILGCMSQIPSLDDYTKALIGHPISELKSAIERPESYASRIGWHEATYSLANGNWVYVEPDRPGCYIHWEVNPQGVIVGYETEGDGCKGQ